MLVEVKEIKKEEIIVVTSLDVAETFGKLHKDVLESIRNIQSDLSTAEFSALFYEGEYKASNGKNNPMYYMNRDGFTLLVMGYTGEKAMQFKLSYIKQFNQMEKILNGKMIERIKGIAVRNALTDAIKESGENDRMHNHTYSTYTDLIYRSIFGKNARKLREEYGVDKKMNLRDVFTKEELEKIRSVEMIVGGFMDCGWGYEEIKNVIENESRKLISE